MDMPTVCRSLLFVPGDRPERFAKAEASGADAIVIDLEDSVMPSSKAAARANCAAYLGRAGAAMVRINALGTPWAGEDLALCRLPGVAGVLLPKAGSGAELAELGRHLPPGAHVLPLIETARGMLNVQEIGAAPGVQRLAFGTVDLSRELGVDAAAGILDVYRAQLVLVSSAAGLQAPVDGVTLELHDPDFERTCSEAWRNGFGGKLCIHPSQVEAVNRRFAPGPEEIQWAREIVELAKTHGGAFAHAGRMVDRPVIARAHRLLEYGRRPGG